MVEASPSKLVSLVDRFGRNRADAQRVVRVVFSVPWRLVRVRCTLGKARASKSTSALPSHIMSSCNSSPLGSWLASAGGGFNSKLEFRKGELLSITTVH